MELIGLEPVISTSAKNRTLISLYLQGRLPLKKFVSERIGLDDIEEVLHTMHSGEVLRSVVVWK